MKLSEAIRLGGMLKPQGKGNESLLSEDAPCALGGALEAIGQQPANVHTNVRLAYQTLINEWPFLAHYSFCPCGRSHHHCVRSEMPIINIIWALNDLHGWSRAQIADWVETFEPPATPMKKVVGFQYRSNNSGARTVASLECGHERVLPFGYYPKQALCWDCTPGRRLAKPVRD